MSRKWLVVTQIAVPCWSNLSANGPFPEQIEIKSYFANATHELCGVKISSREWITGEQPPPLLAGEPREWRGIEIELDAADAPAALSQAVSTLEWLCDRLSFCLQYPILMYRQQVREVGGTSIFEVPEGYQPAKFRRTLRVGETTRDVRLDVPEPTGVCTRTRAALRWFHKGLAAEYEIDRFIFFWVCLEILSKLEGLEVKAPYIAACRHVIERCPTCQALTSQYVNGPSLQRFLVEALGVESKAAKRLWKFRQLLHGANELTDAATLDMPGLVGTLHFAVNFALRRQLKIPDSQPPFVSVATVAISAFGITYTPAISEIDRAGEP